MPKTHTQYVCQQCGRTSAREMGRCPQCGAWNSMVGEMVADQPSPSASHAGRGLGAHSAPRRLAEITGDVDERLPLSMGEFARVLGGGVVPGSVVLIGGDPGIGKSTLLLQVALEMARSAHRPVRIRARSPNARSRCAPCACCARRAGMGKGEAERSSQRWIAGHPG